MNKIKTRFNFVKKLLKSMHRYARHKKHHVFMEKEAPGYKKILNQR